MKFIDSHCHIHDASFFPDNREEVYSHTSEKNIGMICVGTDEADSRVAVDFVSNKQLAWAVVGVHPHESKKGVADIGNLLAASPAKVVGIGEIGLDYFYMHSQRQEQINALEQQLQWAVDYNLPISFHVRDAFDDFWPILNNFSGIRGVLHSFTDNSANAEKAFERGLYLGINGISTFTKDSAQKNLYDSLPLSKLLLETDAPFLTPVPLRGKINEPSNVEYVACHLATQRNVSVDEVATITTANAKTLFDI